MADLLETLSTTRRKKTCKAIKLKKRVVPSNQKVNNKKKESSESEKKSEKKGGGWKRGWEKSEGEKSEETCEEQVIRDTLDKLIDRNSHLRIIEKQILNEPIAT